MSLAQFYALSAPALLGVLAVGFGLFELHRVRRMKANFAAPTAMGVQDSASDQVSRAISETTQTTLRTAVSPSDQAAPATRLAEATKLGRPDRQTLEEIDRILEKIEEIATKSKTMTGIKVVGSEFIVEDISQTKLELSNAMNEVATAHGRLAEAEHKLNEAMDKIARATTAPQEKTGS